MSDPVLTPISHEQFVADVRALAAALRGSGWRPDFLVGIGRGGLAPCTYLSHATHFPMLSVDWSSEIEEFGQALIGKLAARTQGGEKLLVVDDINDSGGTIERLRAALAAAGADLNQVRFGVLIDNSVSKATVDYRARTIDRTVTKDWFVFPWEALAPTEDVIHDAQLVPERIA